MSVRQVKYVASLTIQTFCMTAPHQYLATQAKYSMYN